MQYLAEMLQIKIELVNLEKPACPITTYGKDCQFFRCDYKYKINLPVKKMAKTLQVDFTYKENPKFFTGRRQPIKKMTKT